MLETSYVNILPQDHTFFQLNTKTHLPRIVFKELTFVDIIKRYHLNAFFFLQFSLTIYSKTYFP